MNQTWSADGYVANAGFVADLGAAVLDWLDPQPGEDILDVGCGDGRLTLQIRDAGALVTGLDSSPDLLAATQEKGIPTFLADASDFQVEKPVDAVFSNAALHWVTDAKGAVKCIRSALKPGGRFVAEFGGHGNVAAIITAMRAVAMARGGDARIAHPWYFPTPDAYAALLSDHGFSVQRIALIPRATSLPTGIAGWLATFRSPFFDQFTGAERQAALDDVVALLRPSLCDDAGNWTADYVRLRVEALAI
ncbi:MAG: methyltransferase domain-containing protein [Pseudomonadota bacterium]